MKRYRRSISFPNLIPSLNPNPTQKSKHVRSVSLPCGGTHPLISQLHHDIRELQVWVDLNQTGTTQMIYGLTRLKSIMDSFDNVLQLSQIQDSLSSATEIVESLLEDFLRYVDVYDVFFTSMLGLKRDVTSAQVAIRRNDDFTLGLYVKAQRKFGSEMSKLISNIGSIVDQPIVNVDFQNEIVDVVHDVHGLIVSVSETVFSGFGLNRKQCWVGFGLRKVKKEGGVDEFVKVLEGVENLMELKKKKSNRNEKEEMKMEVLRKMQEMEDCVGEIERESQRVFRSFICTRVSLLNILTHA